MVLIIKSEKARDFLLQNGMVYILQPKQLKKTGKDWITKKRGGEKIFEVEIEEIGSQSIFLLSNYVESSGFKTLTEWHEEIKKSSRGKFSPYRWLYKVTLIKRRCIQEVPQAVLQKKSSENRSYKNLLTLT